MSINKSGWLRGVRWLSSPNCDARPAGTLVDTVVIHGISLPPDQFGGGHVEALFTNRLAIDEHPYFATIAGLRVSAHFFVDRHGAVTQFVCLNDRAWHAGVSFFCGRTNVNDFSVGIEVEGADAIPYTVAQYGALAELVARLFSMNDALSLPRLCGHCDVAPGRKTDPGMSFDWPRLKRAIAERLSRSETV